MKLASNVIKVVLLSVMARPALYAVVAPTVCDDDRKDQQTSQALLQAVERDEQRLQAALDDLKRDEKALAMANAAPASDKDSSTKKEN